MIRPPPHVPTPSHSDQSPLCHRISPSSLKSSQTTHDYPPSAPPTYRPTFDPFSPPHATGISKPVDDLVHRADFLHTHGGDLSPRQQLLLSQQRQFSLRRWHSECDIRSVATQTSSPFSFSSTIEAQYQEQGRSPEHNVTTVLPSSGDATFSADRRPSTTQSAASLDWDDRHAGPLHGVRAAIHIPTPSRASSLLTPEGQNISLVRRYSSTFHNPFNDAIPNPHLGSSRHVMAPPYRAQEKLGNEMCHLSPNVPEARERPGHITDSRKGDASAKAVLMFTGVFSPVVASFIIESYKMLSSDFGDRTSLPTCQAAQELTGSTGSTSVLFGLQGCSPSPGPPPASIVCVNILWLMSLVLSITSALLATLKQQWANKSIWLPKLEVTVTVTLLHLSVSLYLVGLVIFFFTIYKTVAIFVSIMVGLFIMVYMILTILACLDRNWPYRTPLLSSMWWSKRHGGQLDYT